MIYTVQINEKEYEVEVERGKATLLKTTQVKTETSAVGKAPVAAEVPSAPAPVVSGAGSPVVAPMPGIIQDVKVSVGQTVKKGQILLILEAMKMENEVFAPTEGVVTQIQVSKGTSVVTNDILLMIQ